MKLIILIFFLITTLKANCVNAYQDSFDNNFKSTIEETIKKYQRLYKIPKVQVLIGDSRNILYFKSFNTLPDSRFDIASITKVFSSLTLLKILEDKEISIKEKVSDYLSEFDHPKNSHITIEDLLRHTSGFKAGVGPGVLIADNVQESFRAILNLTPTRAYGSYVYSDINFIIVGKLIERLIGKSLDKAIDSKIIIPMGLVSTAFLDQSKKCVISRYKDSQCRVHDPTSRSLGGVTGHAGLYTSAKDLALFAKTFLNRGQLCEKEIFSKELYQSMVIKKPYSMRGLGFDITSPYSRRPRGDYFSHGLSFGHTGYTGTSLWIDPTLDTYMILLTNATNSKSVKESKSGYLDLLEELSSFIGRVRFSE